MITVAALWVIVIGFIVWAVSQSSDSRRLSAGRSAQLEAEIQRLREEVDRLSRQLDRVTDEQSFLLRLLERKDPPRLEGGGEDPQ